MCLLNARALAADARPQVLTLVSKVASKGWWIGRNAAGKEGLVPFNYFEVRARGLRVRLCSCH